MPEQMYQLVFTAVGEVRDKDGNLLSAEPVKFEHEVPESHLREMGLTDEQITEIKEQS